MADVVLVALLVAFFGVARLLVTGCERIIGPDEHPLESPARPPAQSKELAA